MTLYLQIIQTAGHSGQSLLKSNVDLQIYQIKLITLVLISKLYILLIKKLSMKHDSHNDLHPRYLSYWIENVSKLLE